MPSRNGDRGYKVVYSSRIRETDDADDQITRQRSNRDNNFYDDSRSSRDERIEVDRSSRASDSRSDLQGNSNKTTYKVGRNRNSDRYVKRPDASNSSNTERPSDRGRSEYEILRPQKRDDGVYVVDLGASRDYSDRDANGYGMPRGSRNYDIEVRSRRNEDVIYDTSRSARDDRSVRELTYKDVQVTEEADEETNYGRRGRGSEAYSEAAPSKRHRSAMRGRNNSPPEFHQRRREQSVGFYREQITNHDASESRHEKPGAEAHITGRYLVDHRGEYVEVDEEDYRSRPGRRYASQRMSDSRINNEDNDDDKRTYTEETMRKYEYEDDRRRKPYPPQRSRSRRRQRRHDDDDRRSYSEHEYETRVVREEYY